MKNFVIKRKTSWVYRDLHMCVKYKNIKDILTRKWVQTRKKQVKKMEKSIIMSPLLLYCGSTKILCKPKKNLFRHIFHLFIAYNYVTGLLFIQLIQTEASFIVNCQC